LNAVLVVERLPIEGRARLITDHAGGASGCCGRRRAEIGPAGLLDRFHR